MHNGVRDTLTELRSKFSVVKGHRTVQNIILKCFTCKKVKGRRFKIPPSPQLPESSLSDEFAFKRPFRPILEQMAFRVLAVDFTNLLPKYSKFRSKVCLVRREVQISYSN